MDQKTKSRSEFSHSELMRWYKGGRSFRDIMKALQTSQLADISPDELLTRVEYQSWEEIWQDLGVVSP